VKTHHLSIVATLIGFIGGLILILTLVLSSTLAGDVIPTDEWVNFGSVNSTYLGQPVPAGAVVAAFDPTGTKCGEFTVQSEGSYGVMPCYRDDSTTGDDEGAEPGDVISFQINGLPATAVPIKLNNTPVAASTTITWTQHGDVWEVDLHVGAPVTPTPTEVAAALPGFAHTFSAKSLTVIELSL